MQITILNLKSKSNPMFSFKNYSRKMDVMKSTTRSYKEKESTRVAEPMNLSAKSKQTSPSQVLNRKITYIITKQ